MKFKLTLMTSLLLLDLMNESTVSTSLIAIFSMSFFISFDMIFSRRVSLQPTAKMKREMTSISLGEAENEGEDIMSMCIEGNLKALTAVCPRVLRVRILCASN
jgi:hypothetical protein